MYAYLLLRTWQNSVGDVIKGTLIESNSAAVGGGIYAADAAAAFIADSTVAHNVALVRLP